jgi:hypothetical protein
MLMGKPLLYVREAFSLKFCPKRRALPAFTGTGTMVGSG